jgi:hypothetical protein
MERRKKKMAKWLRSRECGVRAESDSMPLNIFAFLFVEMNVFFWI